MTKYINNPHSPRASDVIEMNKVTAAIAFGISGMAQCASAAA